MTKNQRSFDSAVMISSLIPSEKYSCPGSSLRLTKGSTAITGRSDRGAAGSGEFVATVLGAGCSPAHGNNCTIPTNRKPLRANVRIRDCSSPLSPIALRTALMCVASVESATIRPPHSAVSRSSLLTTRSRFRTR